jgi:hypothetical protein
MVGRLNEDELFASYVRSKSQEGASGMVDKV